MTAFRHHLPRHRRLAAWLVALALVMKMLVPSGYMLSTSAGSITVQLCSGYGPQEMVMAMPGMADHGDKKQDHGKAEQTCAFAGLSAPSLAGADPIRLAIVLAFIIATIFGLPSPSAVSVPAFLRPPLRGPPVTA